MLTVGFRQKTWPVFFSGNDPTVQHKRPLQYAAAGINLNSPDFINFQPVRPIHFSGDTKEKRSTHSTKAKDTAQPGATNRQVQTVKKEDATNPFGLSGYSTPRLVEDGSFTPPQTTEGGATTLAELFPPIKDAVERQRAFDAWIASQAHPKFS